MSRIFQRLAVSTLLAGSCLVVQADPPDPAVGVEAGASVTESPAKADRARGAERMVSRMWWNQTAKTAGLGLSETQRQQMESLFLDYLKAREEAIKDQKGHFQAFGDALAAGDPEKIQRAGEELEAAMALPASKQIDMMIEVVSLLSPEQRKTLVANNPKVLSRLWVRSSPRLGGGAGKG